MKTKKLLLPMHLQFFADNPDTGTGDTDQPAGGQEQTTPEDDSKDKGNGKTFSRDEVAKMIAAEVSKTKEAWEKEQQEKQAEAEKLAKMNAQEKAEHEKKQLEAKIAELERSQALVSMSKEASKMLSEASLPYDDDLLGLIVSDDAEATKKAVAIVTNYVSMIKKENARQKTPGEGGQFSTDKKETESVAALAASKRIVK
ncbi:DUF4355 domain-containing protein [Enterococcus faecalis]|uniref:DUF4355 domain-containing protein n=1 Tax=Enterococcus faecalis TaxID=1351 RepID=UPI001142D056|nr:DUF4355 domain-containing protein [Enterococcus faecalis]NSV74123.1 DUF4355 domain-containing protein [Enterococcus faecalis]TQA86129.1 DUF4355 domain-containing protein [Enterococcus faecalis]